MARVIRDVVALLNRLIQMHYDAIDGCKAAVAQIGDARDRAHLAVALEDHRGHVGELAVVVRNLGGEPASQGRIEVASRTRRTSGVGLCRSSAEAEHALLEAFWRKEERARIAYEDATSQPGVPLDVLAALERNLADERKHLAWVAGRLETPIEMEHAEADVASSLK